MGCIVKVINNGYEHPLALKGIIKYILTDKDTKGHTRYYDGYYINPENVEREMMDDTREDKIITTVWGVGYKIEA